MSCAYINKTTGGIVLSDFERMNLLSENYKPVPWALTLWMPEDAIPNYSDAIGNYKRSNEDYEGQ